MCTHTYVSYPQILEEAEPIPKMKPSEQEISTAYGTMNHLKTPLSVFLEGQLFCSV